MQFEAWENALRMSCGHYYGVPSKGQKSVDGHFQKKEVAGLDIIDISCNIDRIDRPLEGVRRDDREYLFLLLQLSGRTNIQQAEARTILVPGDICLLDSTRPAALNFNGETIRYLALHLPRAVLLLDAAPTLLIGKTLSPNRPAVRKLNWHIQEWCWSGRAISRDDLLDLTRSTFSPDIDILPAQPKRSSKSRFEPAVREIESHLNCPELSLAWLAQRVGISTRQLDRDFKSNNTSFVHVIRERRLKLAKELMDLATRTRKNARISDIAQDSGFRDLSNFNRSFRAQFNLTPSEYLHSLRDNLNQV